MSTTEPVTTLAKQVEMVFHYDVTGAPNVRAQYERVDTVPTSAEVRLTLDPDGQSVHIHRIKIHGHRAKKDGSAGQLSATADFWLSLRSDVPAWVLAIGETAEYTVRGWVK